MIKYTFFFSLLLLTACQPRQDIQFQKIDNVGLSLKDGKLVVYGDASFFNPNKLSMRLQALNLDISIGGNRSAIVRQKMNLRIPANNTFSVPVEAQLTFEDGLVNSIKNLFKKTYQLKFIGWVKVSVGGVGFKVPIDYAEEVSR